MVVPVHDRLGAEVVEWGQGGVAMDELRRGLRAKCVEQAAAAFDASMAWEEEHGEARLLEIEEVIEQLRVPITRALMEAVLSLRRSAEIGATVPVCAACGGRCITRGGRKSEWSRRWVK